MIQIHVTNKMGVRLKFRNMSAIVVRRSARVINNRAKA